MRVLFFHRGIVRFHPWQMLLVAAFTLTSAVIGDDSGEVAPPPFQDPRLVKRVVELGGDILYDYQVAPSGAGIAEQYQKWSSKPPHPDRVARFGIDCIHRVEVVNLYDATRESLSAVSQLSHVKELGVFSGNPNVGLPEWYIYICDDDLSVLGQMPQLVGLTINCQKVTGKGLVHLQRLKRLKVLRLACADLSSAMPLPLPLGHLKELTTLSIERAHLDDNEVSFISTLADNIEFAGFPDSRITDDGLRYFLQLHNLKGLSLPVGISRRGIASLASMPSLCNLTLRGGEIDDECMPLLAAMKLKRLALLDTKLSDVGLRTLAGSKTLGKLIITKSRITDDGILVLAEIPTLKEIEIDCGLVALKRLGNKRPDIKGTKKSIGWVTQGCVSCYIFADDVKVSGKELDDLKMSHDKRAIGWVTNGSERIPIRAADIHVSGELLNQLK